MVSLAVMIQVHIITGSSVISIWYHWLWCYKYMVSLAVVVYVHGTSGYKYIGESFITFRWPVKSLELVYTMI